MTIWQARKAVIMGLQHVRLTMALLTVPSQIKINAESIEFYAAVFPGIFTPTCTVPGSPSGSTYRVDLKRIGTFTLAGRRKNTYSWSDHADGTGVLVDGKEPFFSESWRLTCSNVNPDENARIWGLLFWQTRDETQLFANAMNRLRSAARGERTPDDDAGGRDFQQKADAWRALSPKPPIPEEVRQDRLLAEHALREKDLDTAISEYEDGLTSYPVWPEGHFNAALISAELGYYSEALQHMRAYLELVPDAQDAQQARDQMIIWEAELKKAR
jgi:tetratricopeptide (TPR) repeat protein